MSDPTPRDANGDPLEGLALHLWNMAVNAARDAWGMEIAELRDEVHALDIRLTRHQETTLIRDIFKDDETPFGHSVKA